MDTKLDRRRGDSIPALGRSVMAEQALETERAGGARFQSRAVVVLLLDDEQEWFGCARCSVVAPRAEQIIAHQKAHPVAKAQKRRQQRKVTTEEHSRITTVEEADEEETVEDPVPTPAELFGGKVTTARRAAPRQTPLPRQVQRALEEGHVPSTDTHAPEHRALADIARDLEAARQSVIDLERELQAAVRADWRTGGTP